MAPAKSSVPPSPVLLPTGGGLSLNTSATAMEKKTAMEMPVATAIFWNMLAPGFI